MLLVCGSHIMPNFRVPWFWQRQWNFKSKFSCLVYEALSFTDRVAGFVYSSIIDRHHDNYILSESALDEIFEDFQPGQLIKYWTHTDRGYTSKAFARAVYHGQMSSCLKKYATSYGML